MLRSSEKTLSGMNSGKHGLNVEFECRVKSVVPKASHVVFINQKKYLAGNERYLLGTMRNPDWQHGGFIKLTRSDAQSGVDLSRESRATELAGLLGIQSAQIHQRYIDTGDGYGMVILERLSKVHQCFQENLS